MAINKVVYGSTTLIDLTGDTLTSASQLAYGVIAHDRTGGTVTGTNTYDSDTTDATVSADEVLYGETCYANGNKITGTMSNRGAVSGTISAVAGTYTVPQGYHDGSGTVAIDATEQAKIIASNIKSGVEILGVTGSYTGASVSAQSKTVTPTTSSQTVLPDSGYDYLSQVTVDAIPYTTAANSYGTTVTIGAS